MFDLARLSLLAREARAAFPGGFAEAPLGPWTGLRPATPTGAPLLGPVPGARGLWLNVGQGALGFTLAMGSGRVVTGGRLRNHQLTGAGAAAGPAHQWMTAETFNGDKDGFVDRIRDAVAGSWPDPIIDAVQVGLGRLGDVDHRWLGRFRRNLAATSSNGTVRPARMSVRPLSTAARNAASLPA